MTRRKIQAIIFGILTLFMVGFSTYKTLNGFHVGFGDVIVIGTLLMFFLNTMTWGTKAKKDGLLQEDELGQRITEKSSKQGYYLLTLFIFIFIIADRVMNEVVNVFLLILLGLAMITLPIIEYFHARKYQ